MSSRLKLGELVGRLTIPASSIGSSRAAAGEILCWAASFSFCAARISGLFCSASATRFPSEVVGEPRPAIRATTSLGNLVAEALQNNPEIRAAQKEKEAAQQRIAPAGALDDPMLQAGVINLPSNSLSFNRDDMTMKMIGLSQRFSYPGKRDLRQGIAGKDAESVGYGYQETINRVAREIRVAYFDLGLVVDSIR